MDGPGVAPRRGASGVAPRPSGPCQDARSLGPWASIRRKVYPMAPRSTQDSRSSRSRCVLIAGAVALWALIAQTGAAQSPAASGMAGPLPVWVAEGTCDEPGEPLITLTDATAPAIAGPRLTYLSLTELPDPLPDVVGQGRVVLAGGSDAASAVVCGALQPLRDDGLSVGVLDATHDTDHLGTILIRDTGQGTVVEVIVLAPSSPDAISSQSPSANGTPASPDPSGMSPVRSPLPGTSGAPPFSPLPGGASAP